MIKKAILLFMLLFVWDKHSGYAETEVWTYLDNITDQALLLTKQKKYIEAKKMLENFSKEFVRVRPTNENMTMNDLRVISISTDEAIKALVAVTLSHDERVQKVMELRLAMDALHSEHQPMWMQMEEPVIQSFESMKEAVLDNNNEEFKKTYNEFIQQFQIIYPSLVIDLDPDDIAKFDSHIRFLETYDRVNSKNKKEHIHIMEKDIYKLFDKTINEKMDASLLWVMTVTGGLILLVLIYVGIKKYVAEKIITIPYRGK